MEIIIPSMPRLCSSPGSWEDQMTNVPGSTWKMLSASVTVSRISVHSPPWPGLSSICPQPCMYVSLRSFLENRCGLGRRGEKSGLVGRDHQEKVQRKRERLWEPAGFQLLCTVPQALGTWRLFLRPTACSNQTVCVTPYPRRLAPGH